MKDEPKCQPTKHNTAAQQISSRVPVDPFAPPASSFVGDGSPFATTSSGKRPLGRDATKAKHKKIASSSASSADAEFVANLHELNITKTSQWNQEFNRRTTRDDSLFQLKQDHLELEKKKVVMQEMNEEVRILSIYLTTLPNEMLRAYYKKKQEEIMKKL
jgi:tRNA A37 N6-isopentenylltransferase MiaA